MKVDYSNLEQYIADVYKILVPFQIDCTEHLALNPRCSIDSRMGTGKTLMALTAMFKRRPQRILVLCSKNAFYTWKKEVTKWFPDYAQSKYHTYIRGTPTQRNKAWASDSLFYICTYQSFWRDIAKAKALDPDALILDEFHKGGLRNNDTKVSKAVRELDIKKTIPMIPMSGSTNRRGPQDHWNLLNITNPKAFPSYWKFVMRYCIVVDGPFGKAIEGVQNTTEYAQVTKPYFYRIPYDLVKDQLPTLRRERVSVDMSDIVRRVYNDLTRDMYSMLDNGEMIVTSTVLGRMVKLRQLLCCPKILGIDDYGAGIEAVREYIEAKEDHHSVIFTPFRDAVLHLKEYVRQNITTNVFSLWGGDEPETVEAQTKAFKKTRGVIVCSTKFAQSFELETSDNCHHVGYEWDQDDNAQAEGRLQRMTSDISKPIMSYYYEHVGTIDSDIMNVLNSNTKNIKNLYQDIDRLKLLLRPQETN